MRNSFVVVYRLSPAREEMKLSIANAAANSLTCYVREADANLLNLPQNSYQEFIRIMQSSTQKNHPKKATKAIVAL
jgi:hypothetical protein